MTKKGGKIVEFPASAAGYVNGLLAMTYLKKLKSHWKETGGGLSDSEKIFLDAAQGYALGGAMASVARTGADEVETLAKSANQEVADIWSEVDFSSYSALDPYEVRSLFDSLGVSQEKIVDKFQEFTQKKTSKMSELAEDFETLNQSFQQTIQEIEARDQTLAEDFKAWMK